MSPSLLSAIMGCILIFAGLAMVVWQMGVVSWKRPAERSVHVGHEGIKLATTYPGLVVIAIGAVMLMVTAVGTY